MQPDLDLALSTLGPLEGRIMRAVWTGGLTQPFTVRNAQELVPELAYTTVMTTLVRLAEKRLLSVEQVTGSRAFHYRAMARPTEYLSAVSRGRVQLLRQRFGDRALAAFAAELDDLSDEELKRLRELAEQ